MTAVLVSKMEIVDQSCSVVAKVEIDLDNVG